MSSTTEGSRGQALALFALSLSAVLLVMALAFDAGLMILERRDQQGAADAAALAGARYMADNVTKARNAAVQVATANGFTNGVGSQSVQVSTPPSTGPFTGRSGFIEVRISSTRPSIFGALAGFASWPVGARAVATNQEGAGGAFSILALHPTLCDAMLLSGNGNLTAYGNIQVNSVCNNGALRRQGGGNISVNLDGGACNVVGDIKDGGGQGVINCIRNEGAPELPDPLAGLTPPAMPGLPSSIVRLSGSLDIPNGCPGSANPATLAAPAICQFTSSYAGSTWRLYPGLYPGGLKLQGGTFYMEPGVYYIGGGGVDITGTGTVTRSVTAGGTTGPAGGILFYNTQIPGAALGPIILNGASANIQLWPLDIGSRYDGLIIFQDRTLDYSGDDVTINGSTSSMQLRGTIYVPAGTVKTNGSSGELLMDQIISNIYLVNGATGSQIKVLNEQIYRFDLLAAGLVE